MPSDRNELLSYLRRIQPLLFSGNFFFSSPDAARQIPICSDSLTFRLKSMSVQHLNQTLSASDLVVSPTDFFALALNCQQTGKLNMAAAHAVFGRYETFPPGFTRSFIARKNKKTKSW